MGNLWKRMGKGTLISVGVLAILVALGTTAQASFVRTGPDATPGDSIDLVADGTPAQNGQDLWGALHGGYSWNAAHTAQENIGPIFDGGTITIHAGEYNDALTGLFNFPTTCTLEAAGDGAVLLSGTGIVAQVSDRETAVTIDGKNQLTIKSTSGGPVVYSPAGSGHTLKNLTIANNGGHWGILGGGGANNLTLKNVTISSPAGGIGIAAFAALSGWTIDGCTIDMAGGGNAIHWQPQANSTIKDSVIIAGPGARGIYLRGSSTGNVISGNTIIGGGYGVNDDTNQATGNTISGNVIVAASEGIRLLGNNVISGNDITSGWAGVWVPTGTGVDLEITDNTIDASPGIILQTPGATGDITGNTLLGSGAGDALTTWGNRLGTVDFSYNTVDGFSVLDLWGEVTTGATNRIFHNTFAGPIYLGIGADAYDNLFVGGVSMPPIGDDFRGTFSFTNNYEAATIAEVAFSSTDPDDADYLYLSCDTPSDIVTGASDATHFGAHPVFGVCCIEGDEALLAACIEGRNLVKATPGWDKPRNTGKGQGQGVLLNMPLIAHTATTYVDSLDICNKVDAEELHSCIVSYFASGGKSSHFGE